MENNHPIAVPYPQVLPREKGEDDIELLKLWRSIWNRKVAICAFTGVMVVGAVVVSFSMTPVYRAQVSVMIDAKGAKAISFDPTTTASDGTSSQYMETQFELLKSRSLAERVVQELNLTRSPQFAPPAKSAALLAIGNWLTSTGLAHLLPGTLMQKFQAPPEQSDVQRLAATTRSFMDLISVEPQGKSQLAKVQVDLNDPQMAAAAANSLANGFIESQLKTSIGSSETATSWMNSRLGELGEKLKESEARLQAYRESENLVDVKGVGTISATELSLTSERMIDARRARAEAQSQYQQVKAMSRGGWEQLASVPAVLADPVVQQFKAQQAKAQAKVDELSSRYGARHPAMDAARSELNAASASLKVQVEQVAAGIERNYQLAAANESSLQASVNTNKSQIQDISRKEFKLQELQREVDSNRSLYDTFVTRIKETTATSDLNTSNTRIVDTAMIPVDPIKPRKSLFIALAALMGLVIGAAVTLLLDALNNTFQSVEQVEDHLNIPVVGILPLLARRERKHLAEMFKHGRYTRFNESIRTIRTNVMLSGYEKPQQVIVITSSLPGEGKTTVSINLAQAMGQMEKVLLIDADLRRPSLAKNLGLSPQSPGLSNLIAGTATFEECRKSVDGIDVICAGTATDRPLELLSSPRFAKALDVLKTRYTRIIIDSSPTQAVSDSKVLATLAQSVLYVVKSASTSISLAEKGVAQLLQHKAPMRGIIINQVDIGKASKFGNRFDGYYDYHGYSQTPPAIAKTP
jgi:capsular exopolysaccharide synthesis family protein